LFDIFAHDILFEIWLITGVHSAVAVSKLKVRSFSSFINRDLIVPTVNTGRWQSCDITLIAGKDEKAALSHPAPFRSWRLGEA